jgi:Ca2+-binding RTX toxin-like protein
MAGDDSLSGGSGNDRLIGSTGNDRITCGGGQDIVQFDAELDPLTNLDSITDFNPADDEIRLIGAAFPALSTAGALPASALGLARRLPPPLSASSTIRRPASCAMTRMARDRRRQ